MSSLQNQNTNNMRSPRSARHKSSRKTSPFASLIHRIGQGSRKTKTKRGKIAINKIHILQCLVLLVLCVLLVISNAKYNEIRTRYQELTAAREEEERQYRTQVDRHRISYRDLIEKYAERFEINPAYIAAIIYRESSFDPLAVSNVGARGLMQLMPDTGIWMAEKAKLSEYTHDDLFDPETNIALGTRYLRYLSDQFSGDPILVCCGYHAGAGNVRSWLKNYSSDGVTLSVDEIPMQDTKTYAERVTRSYAIYLQHYFTSDSVDHDIYDGIGYDPSGNGGQ